MDIANKIMDNMKDIEYGWVNINGVKNTEINNLFSKSYVLQSPPELIKNKIGICWDQVELERFYFNENGLNIDTYFVVHYDDDKCPTHTLLIFYDDNKFYWFEHSWKKFRGIHMYSSLNELLVDVQDKFIKYELNNKFNKNNLFIIKYTKPKYGISVLEFYKHCEKGEYVKLKKFIPNGLNRYKRTHPNKNN
ncbi:MAG: hypothetical protein PHE54_00535 [Bacilli bacterium]|nr:hypothetical protein [Bacilli bacterium]